MMNVNANNVANVNTDGFIPKDTRMSSTQNSVNANVRTADNTGSQKSQTDLAKEIPDQIVASKATAVNVTAIKTQDEMLGSLLDMKA
jgi:flagellar hook protein FlgE